MAGTAKKVLVSGITDDTIRQIADSLNTLIDNFDTHTHSGVTAGAAASGAPSTPSTAGKIFDTLTNTEI